MKTALAASALILAVAAPLAIQAAPEDGRPITGTIVSVDSKYQLTLQDNQKHTETVVLHQGTIINPLGARLLPGMNVTILGASVGPDRVAANEIDSNSPEPFHPIETVHRQDFGY